MFFEVSNIVVVIIVKIDIVVIKIFSYIFCFDIFFIGMCLIFFLIFYISNNEIIIRVLKRL